MKIFMKKSGNSSARPGSGRPKASGGKKPSGKRIGKSKPCLLYTSISPFPIDDILFGHFRTNLHQLFFYQVLNFFYRNGCLLYTSMLH